MEIIKHKINTISKRIGKRFNFDLPYFIDNGFWIILAQGTNMLASLIMSIVFARFLSKETFGEYQMVISFLGIFSILSYSGLNTSILRSIAKGYDYSYAKAIEFSFKKSLFAIPLLTGVSIWYYAQNKSELALVFIVTALFFSFMYAHNKWAAYLKGKEKFKIVAKQQIIQNITINLLLVIATIVFPENLLIITGVYLITNTSFNTLWHIKVKKSITNNKVDNDCIPYGKYMTKMGVFSIIISYFDKILIGFIDLEILAIYAIALKLFDIIKQMLKNLYSISAPKFAKKNIKIENSKIFFLLFTGIIFTIGLYFISKPIIIYFYTESYSEVADIFRKLILVLPLVFVSPLFANKANAQKDKTSIKRTFILVPILVIISAISVLILTESVEYFILTKVYITQIAYFLILVPIFKKIN